MAISSMPTQPPDEKDVTFDMKGVIKIFAMALVTYLTRIGGVWLMSRIALPSRAKAWLTYLPGAVIVSLVAPTVLSTGVAETGAALATILVAARTRNLLLAMIVGVGVVVILRTLLAHIH